MSMFYYDMPVIKAVSAFEGNTTGSALAFYDRPCALFYGL